MSDIQPITQWAPEVFINMIAWPREGVQTYVKYEDHVEAVEQAKKRGYGKAEYDLRMVGPDSFDMGWHNGYDSGYRAGLAALENLEKDLKNFENILEYIKANKPEKF
jgi:hypothetical protein